MTATGAVFSLWLESMNELCDIALLGGLQVRRGDRSIAHFRTHKTGALLAFLAYRRERAHSREMLAGLFWPDASAEAGRLSLRVALNALRRQLEPPGVLPGSVLRTGRDIVQLAPGSIVTDVIVFENAVQRAASAGTSESRLAAWAEAAAAYTGELLPGYYEDWIGPERSRLSAMAQDALSGISISLQQLGNTRRAVDLGLRAAAAAPYDEAVRMAVMRLCAAAGRQQDGLCLYAEFERALHEKLGERPSAEMTKLADELRAATEAGRRLQGRVRGIGPSVVASLPQGSDLPAQATRFFGRDGEIGALVAVVRPGDAGQGPMCASDDAHTTVASRLITLTGPGGVGKTRLAIEAARRIAIGLRVPAVFVGLAGTDDPEQVPGAIADALKLPRVAAADPLEQVLQTLAGRDHVLILDNVEHLLVENIRRLGRAVAAVELRSIVQTLLARTDRVTILVTSRQMLALSGEREFPVGPLPTPSLMARPADGAMAADSAWAAPSEGSGIAYPSVQLFLDRARAVRPDLKWNDANAAAIATICARLEGLPLSIELAAAWSQVLSPTQMLGRISRLDQLLVSRRKDCAERHVSLEATIQWSYGRLPVELQRFLGRLAVFRDGWTLELAEEVCGEPNALHFLAELRARSMAMVEENGDEMRYRLLESVRQFADAQLENGEREWLASRHALAMLNLAERARVALKGAEQLRWRATVSAEQQNLRAALVWLLGSGETRAPVGDSCITRAEAGLRLAAALEIYWQVSGLVVEGRDWLSVGLEQRAMASFETVSAALAADAELALTQGDDTGATKRAAESLELEQEASGSPRIADMLLVQSIAAFRQGDAHRADALLNECERICRWLDYPFGLAAALRESGRRRGFTGDFDIAEALLAESLMLFESLHDLRSVASVWFEQAIILGYRQNYERAHAQYERALGLFKSVGDQLGMSWAQFGIGYTARLRGDHVLATSALAEHLHMQRQILSKKGISIALRNLGCVARDRGEYGRSAALLNDALHLFREIGERQGIAETLGSLGVVAMFREDYVRAREYHSGCLEYRRAQGYKRDVAESLCYLGTIEMVEGNFEVAQEALDESVHIADEIGCRAFAFNARGALAELSLRKDDLPAAGRAVQDYLARLQPADATAERVKGIQMAALLGAARSQWRRAVRLFAAASDTPSASLMPYQRADLDR
ncbi:MAG TPA: BTAD domain-containing putative transcriptional regulator, partial [Chthonomonadaceae bacterium]|nr:BTAD domain-containing putative transcriptional regulator [Chthonomonadaceae bacterium]